MKKELLNLKEHSSEKYTPRTYFNAKSADLTVAFATDLSTAGEKCTHKAAGDKYIGFLLDENADTLTIARALYTKMKKDNVQVLNIAGNGIYTLNKYDCDQNFINEFVYNVLAQVHQYLPIKKIFTGGQTGVDLAGAVTGYLLEIPTEVTLPKGFIQRFEDKKDVQMTYESVFSQIENGATHIIEQAKLTESKNNKPKV